LPQVEGEASAKRKFKPYPIGYFHIDIAEVRTAQGKLYLLVAIDRTSKFVFVEPMWPTADCGPCQASHSGESGD
jgi:hypothetical protein